VESDGANVGNNPIQTAGIGDSITYTWYAPVTKGRYPQESLGPVLLQDMADFRNHRHHGLIGALIVEDEFATPFRVETGASTANSSAQAWYGVRATIHRKPPTEAEERYEEAVLLLQDGLRFFLKGNADVPISDKPYHNPEHDPTHMEEEVDDEDQGQKGFNYRSEPVGPFAKYNDDGSAAPGDWLFNPTPATPVFLTPVGRKMRLHLIGGCDKPRNHSFTVHGVSWPEWRFRNMMSEPKVASESAITCGTVRTFEFTPAHIADHAYRSGVLKWAVPQGLWGIIRVGPAAKAIE
jgi:manganese oxidase